jgi:uncharacterized membrane protein YkoI
MTLFRTLLAAILAASLTVVPADARPRPDSNREAQSSQQQPQSRSGRDSDRAFEATQEGRSMPLPQLERKVLPFMGGADYLGPELNGGTYRLKFMQNGRVIWVDVDAQTGRIIRRSRN